VPLNLEVRKIERQTRKEDRLRRENERRQALGLDPVESIDDIAVEEQPDILLDQAAQIVLDLVVLESPDASMLTRATGT
jgi:carboxyl-terminal processing protease